MRGGRRAGIAEEGLNLIKIGRQKKEPEVKTFEISSITKTGSDSERDDR
jgi:hypothetical protein